MHGGASPQARRAAARRVATWRAVAVLDRLGVPIDVDPLEVLLQQVQEAAGNVVVLRAMVQQLPASVPDGIAGPNHLGDGAPHVLVVMYDKERDRLAQMAKLCLDAGVAERRVRIAEAQGELLARVINGILSDLKLTKGQREKAPGIVGHRLREVAAAVPAAGDPAA